MTTMPLDRRSHASQTGAAPLTARECEVIRLVALGWRDRQIARTLGIAPCSVSWHVRNILKKLGLHSRTAAACYAVRHGLA